MRRFVRIVLVLIVLVVAASIFNVLYARHLAAKYPVPGRIVEVNGHRMHIDCSGAGSPTVVLESGQGGDWLEWQLVQPELSKTTRVCSYDRAGLGWSDPQPGERDAKNIAAQLHALLLAAGEHPPFVMVGASSGALHVRQFASDFPRDIAGMVFVDGSLPEQVAALPYGQDSPEKRSQRHFQVRVEWLKTISGYWRLTGQCKGELEKGFETYTDYAAAENCRPAFATSYLGEWDDFWLSAEEAGRAHCCSDFPVLVISQDPDRPKPGWDQVSLDANPIWANLQESLKQLSPRSRRIIARGAGHHIYAHRPDVVISGIAWLIGQVRDPRPDDPAWGTTVVQ
jgi:pimeloyl-ACP methyl ester carboxylesterase